MAVQQRLRAQVVIQIHPSEETVDRRGNRTIRPLGAPLSVRAWAVPDRGARAEVAGQMDIEVYKLGTRADLTEVNVWSRVQWNGKWWDIIAPPEHHGGTRHTRHWTIGIRRRPDDGGLNG